MKTTQEKILFMISAAFGASIECRNKMGGGWETIRHPEWDWAHCDYRFKDQQQEETQDKKFMAKILDFKDGEKKLARIRSLKVLYDLTEEDAARLDADVRQLLTEIEMGKISAHSLHAVIESAKQTAAGARSVAAAVEKLRENLDKEKKGGPRCKGGEF